MLRQPRKDFSMIDSSHFGFIYHSQHTQDMPYTQRDTRATFQIEIIGLKLDFYSNFDFELPKDEINSKSRSNRSANRRFDHSMSCELNNMARCTKRSTFSIETTLELIRTCSASPKSAPKQA